MVYDTQNVMITFAYNDHHIIVEYALYLQKSWREVNDFKHDIWDPSPFGDR